LPKIKKIQQIGKTNRKQKLNQTTRVKLFKQNYNKNLDKNTTFNQKDFDDNIKSSLFTNEKITLDFAIKKSASIDKLRNYSQLKLYYLKAKIDNSFIFIVKSSGLYEEDKHQVNIKFNPNRRYKRTSDKIKNSQIKFQCSCGAFTYRLRYIATKNGCVLGLKETRYPKVRNRFLKGMLCKHLIRVFNTLPKNQQFISTFERYLKNENIRITKNDKIGTINASNR